MKIVLNKSVTLSNWITDLQEFQLDNYFDTTVLGRAYDYISKVSQVSIQKNIILCQIVGTTLYDIKLEKVGIHINATCSCPHDKACKHIAAAILSLMNINWDII